MNNKLINHNYIQDVSLLFFSTLLIIVADAQGISYTRPEVTNKWKEYKRQTKTDSSKRMLELKQFIPGLVYDLKYASIDNFMHRRMYPENTTTTFLRLPAALALQKVQSELHVKGLGIKVFDAYRPYSVTIKFWELLQDERYVANPSKGSGHNRGTAVDLTIINLNSGEELNMGTGFDNFSDSAHLSFSNLPEEILQNRLLLKSVMEKYGFKSYELEWWHYFIPEASKYEILDIDFRKLRKNL